jgi:hypothetical protein
MEVIIDSRDCGDRGEDRLIVVASAGDAARPSLAA